MTENTTEKLIELVRKYPCLYNMKNISYKNIVIKAKLWEQIGNEINATGDAARKKWKSLRDNYMRYKKEVVGTTGQAAKKFTKWPWASQLQFLDITLTDRERSSNIRQSTPEISSPETPQPETPPPETPPPETPPPETPPPETPPPETPPARSRVKKCKNSESEMDKVINIIHKKKQEYDSIDHLFRSYAQTFNTFSKENQIKAKVELAKLFASIETEELQKNVQILNAPHYSFISTEDLSTISGPEDLSPVTVIDLSTYNGGTTSDQQLVQLLPQRQQRNETDMQHVVNLGASTSTDCHIDFSP